MCPPVSSSAQQAVLPARSAGHNTSPNITLALLSPTPPTSPPSQASHPHWDKKSTVNGAESLYRQCICFAKDAEQNTSVHNNDNIWCFIYWNHSILKLTPWPFLIFFPHWDRWKCIMKYVLFSKKSKFSFQNTHSTELLRKDTVMF